MLKLPVWPRAWLIAGLTLVLGHTACAQDRRTDKSQLTIMTFNAEFLWDGVDPEEGQAEFPWRGDPDRAEDHMRLAAQIISRANPDIINLVEIEDGSVVWLMRDRFLANQGYEVFFIKGKDTYTGQDVCLLSRVDPVGGTVRRDERKGLSGTTSKSVSKHHIARFDLTGGIKFALIGVHFVAIPTHQGRIDERQAQADAIVGMARDEKAAGFDPVILGDFNDYDGAADAIDHSGHTPITTVLAALRRQDAADGADDLVSAAAWVDRPNRYTAWFDANHDGLVTFPVDFSSIDHILLPQSLAQRVVSVQIPHEHDPMNVSDHFPVIVRLRTGAPPPPPNPAGSVRIVKLLPDPSGDDRDNEKVWVKNTGAAPVSLSGWKLRDKGGATWDLAPLGTLAPGQTKEIQRSGGAMSLNNDGDTIELLDSSAVVVHTVTYEPTGRDQEVQFPE
jgi:exonuclease III